MKYCIWNTASVPGVYGDELCHFLYSNENRLLAIVVRYSGWLTAHCVVEPGATSNNQSRIHEADSINEGKALVEQIVNEAGWLVITDPKLINML